MSAIGGAGAVLVTVTLSFGDVKHDAADAHKDAAEAKAVTGQHETRIVNLELKSARDEERWEQVKSALLRLASIQSDIAEIKAKVTK